MGEGVLQEQVSESLVESILLAALGVWSEVTTLTKVNGQDLSRSSHDEAVEAFRAAKEPIVVEVLRRVNKTKMKNRSPTMVSVATQTEEEVYAYPFQGPPSPPPVHLGYIASGLYEPSSRRPVAFSANTDMGLTDIEMANAVDFDDTFFDERTFEMEYEEVVLQRTSSEEKLGLTLCYGSVEDEVTDIFISEIEPSSIAAQDGRIREGDQILQINSIDVHSREQAISLFSDAQPHITLLVARPQLQLDDGFMDEQNDLLDDPSVELLEKHHHDNMAFTSSILQERLHFDEEGGTTDTATTENSHKHEKDSGVGRTDESTRNEESSEQELMDNESLPPHFRPECSLAKGDHHCSNDSFTSNDLHDREILANEISTEECNKFRAVLENKCQSVESSPRRTTSSGQGSQSSLDQELAALNRQMEEIQIECEEIVESHLRGEQGRVAMTSGMQDRDAGKADAHRSPRVVPRMGTRLDLLKHVQCQDATDLGWVRKDSSHRQPLPITQPGVHYPFSHTLHHEKEKDPSTTSAYNTGGESCRSTPLTLELNQVCDGSDQGTRGSMLCLATSQLPHDPALSDTEKQTQTLSPVKTREYSSDGSMRSSQTAMNTALSNNVTPVQENGNILHPAESLGESLQDIYARYADVMYTNEANLQHTIAVQQKLFEQQISQKTGKLQRCGGISPQLNSSPGSTLCVPKSRVSQQNSPGGESSTQMEWVVKRRPDGTRYITRRPVRNKILKERAKKLAEERCGMTTDDDAMSELKVGRYWSKDDRKKHLEKARDQKRKKEQLIRQRMETLKEGEEKTNLNIVELSHRKMMKHKGKKVFDDFMTVQEMLAHGSKVPSGKTYNPLLSVTTV